MATKNIVINGILYVICLLRELFVRLIQFFTGDPLDRLRAPYWYYPPLSAPAIDSAERLPVCIITGGDKGIGWETALNMAKTANLRVIITQRDPKSLDFTKNEFRTLSGNPNVEVLPLDLSSLKSIRAFANIIQERDLPVHILIHNAGCLPGKTREITEDGFELSWQTNYLGPFYLNQLLLPQLKKAVPPARIVTLTSVSHVFGHVDMTDLAYVRKEFNYSTAYADAKLALLLFSKELQRRLEREGRGDILSVACHPGLVASGFYERHVPNKNWLIGFKSPQSGARTSTFLALAPANQLQKGGYYAECLAAPQSFEAMDHVVAELLWDETEKLLNIKLQSK